MIKVIGIGEENRFGIGEENRFGIGTARIEFSFDTSDEGIFCKMVAPDMVRKIVGEKICDAPYYSKKIQWQANDFFKKSMFHCLDSKMNGNRITLTIKRTEDR